MDSTNEYKLLTRQQKRFAHEYVMSLNAKDAAVLAGHSPATAARAAKNYFNPPHVKAHVELMLQAKAKYAPGAQQPKTQASAVRSFGKLKLNLNNDNCLAEIVEVLNAKRSGLKSVRLSEVTTGYFIETKVVFHLRHRIGA